MVLTSAGRRGKRVEKEGVVTSPGHTSQWNRGMCSTDTRTPDWRERDGEDEGWKPEIKVPFFVRPFHHMGRGWSLGM